MATTVSKYVGKCQEIVDAKPAYKNGASSLTECDCIGMDKYAYRECGVSFSTSGTNYTIRNQVEDIHDVKSASDLSVGDVVFKYRKPGESGYDLPAKYKPGGNQYNGDINDYYHIGTVKSVSPLQIIHMTTPTAKTDTKIGKWAVAAKWKAQYIMDDTPTPEPAPDPPMPDPDPVYDTAIVGNVEIDKRQNVNLRSRPSKLSKLIDRVPCGDAVTVLEAGDKWTKVRWNGKIGYMMSRYLIYDSVEFVSVLIPNVTMGEAESIKRTYPDAEIMKG